MNEDTGRLPGSRPSDEAVPSSPEAAIPSAWPEVEWEDGYPIAEDDDFADWDNLPMNFHEAASFILRELPKAAGQCCASCEVQDVLDEYSKRPAKRVLFSTGGWSGAESLIGFIEKRFDTSHFMESWRRGGHFVFEIPERFLAQAMSAGTVETERLSPQDTSAVHESGCAQPSGDQQ